MYHPSILVNRLPKKLLHLEKFSYREYLAAIICLFCVFNFGTTLAWEMSAKNFFTHQNEHGFTLSDEEWKWISCCLPVAATISSLPVGLLAKNHGCKTLIYLQTIPYIVSWMMLIFTKTRILIYISRFLQGMCGAAVCVAVPIYTMDISTIHHRGRIGSMFFGVLMYGIYLSYILTQLVGIHITNMVNLGQVILNGFLILLPESPTYYVYHNKMEEAKKSLTWLHGSKHVQRELNTLEYLLEDKVDSIFEFWLILKKVKKESRGIIKASVIMALFNLCGGMMILSDRVALFYENDSDNEPLVFYNRFLLIGMFCGHLTCFLVIDRFGRRPLLLCSTLVMASFALLIYCWFEWPSHRNDWDTVPFIFCFLYTVSFSIGLGPVSWILSTELMSTKVHFYGNAIMAFNSWLFFTITAVWLNFFEFNYSIFGLMFIASVVAFSYTVLLVPNTKSVSLSRIQLRMVPSTDVIASTTSSRESIVDELSSMEMESVVERSKSQLL